MRPGFSSAVRALLILTVLVVLFSSVAEAKKRSRKSGSYRVGADAAILLDVRNSHRYYGRDIHQKILPASTLKLMVALFVLEKKKLDDVVVVSNKASQALPSKVYLRPGEKFRVRELLYALLLNSANDVAIALAESVAGSEKKFVEMMNRRAHQLGAKNTLFANSHGLPSVAPQHTTISDMVLIFRAAWKKPFIREALKIKTMTIRSVNGRSIALKSHNKALFLGWKGNIYGKTGYTKAAKACFIGQIEKDGKALIVGVFGSGTRWDDVKHLVEHYGGIDL
ncbi:MAG: D-alanyl-D-alanine carboxypeptidase [Elusimicrobia bacterium]|nr:D-alanyl-D-alanine carboxypeptidase [Elusimicrobiota bacterium]